MTNKMITLISMDGSVELPPAELVKESASLWIVRLAPECVDNSFYKHQWRIKPVPLPTEPGRIIRATIRGVSGVVAIRNDDGYWPTVSVGDCDISDIDLDTVEVGRVTFGDES